MVIKKSDKRPTKLKQRYIPILDGKLRLKLYSQVRTLRTVKIGKKRTAIRSDAQLERRRAKNKQNLYLKYEN